MDWAPFGVLPGHEGCYALAGRGAMEVVLSSSFVDYDAVKLSGLYCDRIILPWDYVGTVDLGDVLKTTPEGEEVRTGVVRTVYKTMSAEVEADLNVLFSEGVLVFAEGATVSYDLTDVFG